MTVLLIHSLYSLPALFPPVPDSDTQGSLSSCIGNEEITLPAHLPNLAWCALPASVTVPKCPVVARSSGCASSVNA